MAQINLGLQSNETFAKAVSTQRLINLYPESSPSPAKTPIYLIGTPGTSEFSDTGGTSIYGSLVVKGILYVVSGENLCKINSDGNLVCLGSIGITGDIVQMSSNDKYLVMQKPNGELWTYDTELTSLAQVTDPDLPTTSSVTFIAGRTVVSVANSDRFYWSAVSDPTSWDALDFATAEGRDDNLVNVFAKGNELWLFGENTVEIWYPTGDANAPFVRTGSAFLEKGCLAKNSVAQEDNFVYWLSSDRIIYRAQGYNNQRISTHGIENEIIKFSTVEDAIGFTYTEAGHDFYVLTFPTEQRTFVFDAMTNLWHERQTSDKGSWEYNNVTFAYGKNIIGSSKNGKVYELNINTYTEDGNDIYRTCRFPPFFQDDRRVFYDKIYIDMEAGQGLIDNEDHFAILDWSDDGGNTFSNSTVRSYGKIGDYKARAVWRRLGSAKQRTFRIKLKDNIKIAILGCYANVRLGAE